MKRMKNAKTISLLMVLLLVLQLVPLGTALAAEEQGIDPEMTEAVTEDAADELEATAGMLADGIVTPFAIVDDGYGSPTINVPNLDTTSYVTRTLRGFVIKGTDGTPLPFTTDENGNKVYQNVPDGVTVAMDLSFFLADIDYDVPGFIEYKQGDTFTIPLPGGITFNEATGTIQAYDTDGGYFYDIATYVIAGETMTFTLTGSGTDTTLHGGAANTAHQNKHAEFTITGTVNVYKAGDPNENTVTIGSETVIIKRPALDTDYTMIKRSTGYNAETNELSWEVVVRPPASAPSAPFNDFSLVETLSGPHTFVRDSFQINGTGIPDVDLELKFESLDTKATYTFPATPSITGEQTLTYKTKPTDFTNPDTPFGNTVTLKDDVDSDKITKTANKRLTWLTKTGTPEPNNTDGTTEWKIKIMVPGSGKITEVDIRDQLHPDLELIQGNPSYPIKFGSNTLSAGDYEYTAHLAGDIFTYRADEITGEVTLSFWTKIKSSALYKYLDKNAGANIPNDASLDWHENPTNGTSGPGAGSGPVGVIGRNGVLDKVAIGGTQDYKFAPGDNGTIKWRITVNRNEANLHDVKLEDVVPSGHELLIGGGYPFEVNGNGTTHTINPVSAISSSYTDLPFTYVNSQKFTYNFGDIDKSYTVTFYTRLTDTSRDTLYENGANGDGATASFKNDAYLTFTGGGASAQATKVFRLQMLKKTAGKYNYNTKETEWTIVANRNRLPLNTPITLTDNLPGGMGLKETTLNNNFMVSVNGAAAASLTSVGGSATQSGQTITLNLPNLSEKEYKITYTTVLSNDELKGSGSWPDQEKKYENNATLTDGGSKTFNVKADVTVESPVITKNYVYVSGSDVIQWTAIINNTHVPLTQGIVEDELTGNAEFAPAFTDGGTTTHFVRLWKANVHSTTGAAEKGDSVLLASAADATHFSYAIDSTGKKLTVNLPTTGTSTPIDDAYILEYSVYVILPTGAGPISNKIKLLDSTTDMGGGTVNTQKSVNVSNVTSIGGSYSNKITVTKTGPGGATTPLTGAQYQLFYGNTPLTRDGNNITATTGTDPAVFSSLPKWAYNVREIAPPTGYLLPATIEARTKSADLSTGDKAITFENAIGFAKVEIAKYGPGSTPLTGGSFKLTPVDGSPVLPDIITGRNTTNMTAVATGGVVKFENVPMGRYELTEETAVDNHKHFPGKIIVDVEYNGSKTALVAKYSYTKSGSDDPYNAANKATSYTLVNQTDTSVGINEKVTFKKVGTDGTTPIIGATFELWKQSPHTKVGSEIISGADGMVTFPDVPAGTYYVYETITPDGYLKPNDDPSAKPILDVTVRYNAAGEGGKAANTYLVVETTAGTGAPTGALDGTSTPKTFKNFPAVADVEFKKLSTQETDPTDPKIKINGGTFELRGKAIDGYPKEPGTGDYVATASAKDGKVTFESVPVNRTGEKYTIREISAPSGYFPTDDTLEVEIEYTNIYHIAVKTPVFTGGISKLDNKPIPYVPGEGKATVLKTDEDNKPLMGATFTLYNAAGNTVASAVSGADGIATFTNIAPDASYTIRETAAPEGYELSTEVISFKTGDGTTHSFTMVNKKKAPDTGTIEIHKTNEGGNSLPGATFTLYDKDGNTVATAVSDDSGQVRFKDIPAGDYTIRETAAPSGYILSAQVLSLSLAKGDNRSFTFVNTREEEENPGSGTPTGSIGLLKTNTDGERLAGAEFSLYDEGDALIERAVTGTDGIARFSKLPYGSYTVRETGAPAGYLLFDGALPVEISAANPDRSFTLRNLREDEPGIGGWEEEEPGTGGWEDGGGGNKLPQTGGIPQSFFLLVAGLALLGLGVFTLKGRKAQRKPNAPGTDE